MNKKRLVSMLFVSTLAFGSMSAQTSMVAYGEDGKYWTFDINKVEKVTFENKSLVFYTTQRNAIDLTQIQSIKFVLHPSWAKRFTFMFIVMCHFISPLSF